MAGAAAELRSVSAKLKAVPDEAVSELVRWFIPRSEQIGGRMLWFGKRVKLTARPRKPKKGEDSSSVTMVGVPISCWSIKSYGRKGNYDVRPRRKQALSLKAFAPGAVFAHVTIHRAVSGDHRWDRLVGEAEVRFPDVVSTAVDRAVA